MPQIKPTTASTMHTIPTIASLITKNTIPKIKNSPKSTQGAISKIVEPTPTLTGICLSITLTSLPSSLIGPVVSSNIFAIKFSSFVLWIYSIIIFFYSISNRFSDFCRYSEVFSAASFSSTSSTFSVSSSACSTAGCSASSFSSVAVAVSPLVSDFSLGREVGRSPD